ncbi:BtaA family protein [Sulfidibacter corallicola]|uniref:BtaA family protein n=1 Tax=Sulfidibacter corallicola TaxID=2818388 RepID=A0A8A4TN57_SULCO|nr:BtaA family protein [Sulfidibacter corallicola]QTD50980.1 BtaA family protein [Sulfidibacter corallicola]
MRKLGDWTSKKIFNFVHQNNLVYNTCWEDPRLDRTALSLGADDNILMITSAGCNALDYALDQPNHIYAVDMNPRQNALLELKMAGIRSLDFETFFELFGKGRHDEVGHIYRDALRPHLSHEARAYWDKKYPYFEGGKLRPSFYFRGSSGAFARLLYYYINQRKLRETLVALFDAGSLEEQENIYHNTIKDAFWTAPLRRMIRTDSALSLLGIPRPQREQIERTYVGGIAKFIEDCVETVFTLIPTRDNYFWWLYVTGEYHPQRCPEYLREENFQRLKDGLVDRISTHTCTIHEFLEGFEGEISRYVLLDHMDWLSSAARHVLAREWQAIVDRSARNGRVLWRSGGLMVDFVDPIKVRIRDKDVRVGDLLTYDHDLAAQLHRRDRVGTYGSFYIADLATV